MVSLAESGSTGGFFLIYYLVGVFSLLSHFPLGFHEKHGYLWAIIQTLLIGMIWTEYGKAYLDKMIFNY